MHIKTKLLAIFIFAASFHVMASDTLNIEQTINEQEMIIAYQKAVDSITQSLTYDQGEINLKGDIAKIKIPDGFKFINGKDSDMVLSELWGNPPVEEESDRSYGMLIPIDDSPMSDSSFAINITYTEEGYIDDEEANNIDYNEMLTSMQADAIEVNEVRKEMGYPAVNIVGWASPPFYDATNKKLHWAKELNFEGFEDNTLNYNVRILGRKGYLQLNVIGEMYVFEDIKKHIDPIIESVNFNQGHQYADFDPSIDKVAAYGIGALITGKVLAKAGILAKIGLVLAKFWKIIALAVVGLFAGIRKFFGGKKEENSEPTA